MELSGKIVHIQPLQEGTSKNGPWKKQQYIIEVPGNYPKKVCVMVWGDRIDDFKIKQGEDVTFSIDIESREFNGRWYTDVKAWKVSRGETASTPEPTPPPGDPVDFQVNDQGEDDDDLPF
jgi:hypothetical protein